MFINRTHAKARRRSPTPPLSENLSIAMRRFGGSPAKVRGPRNTATPFSGGSARCLLIATLMRLSLRLAETSDMAAKTGTERQKWEPLA